MVSGEMSKFGFTSLLSRFFDNLAKASIDGVIDFHCTDRCYLGELLEVKEVGYRELKNVRIRAKAKGVWDRSTGQLVS